MREGERRMGERVSRKLESSFFANTVAGKSLYLNCVHRVRLKKNRGEGDEGRKKKKKKIYIPALCRGARDFS